MAAKEFDATTSGGSGSYIPRSPTNRMVLHLGIVDVPYANRAEDKKVPQAKKGKANKPIEQKTASGMQTTGDVAEILEKKYDIMQTFADAKLPQIAEELEDSIAGELESLIMGGRPSGNPFQKAESAIGTMFKNFILTQEVEGANISGVPTQAALDGVNHRLKHPYAKKNSRRPSFIDTGMYVSHFQAWIE
jgi:hypothetical protein